MESEKLHRNTLKSYSNNYTCKSSIKLTTRVKKASFFFKKKLGSPTQYIKNCVTCMFGIKKK